MYPKFLRLTLAAGAFMLLVLVRGQAEVLQIKTNEADEITPVNASDLISLQSFDDSTHQVIFSPDASMLAVARQQGDADFRVSVIDLQTSATALNIQGRMDFFRNLVWSPDSSRLAVTSVRTTGSGVQEASVKVFSISHGDYLLGSSDVWYTHYFDLTDGNPTPVEMMWSPSGTMIAVAFPDQLNIYDSVQAGPLVSLDMVSVVSVAWSSDGRFIVTEQAEGAIEILGIAAEN